MTGPMNDTTENGIPVIIRLIPEKKTKDALSVVTRNRTATPVALSDKIFYRIPDIVNVVVEMGEEQLYNSGK